MLSWTQRSSKFVVAIAGFNGFVTIATSIILTQPMPWQVKSAEASYQAIAAQDEATRLQAIAEREGHFLKFGNDLSVNFRSDVPTLI
jgi:hypothetical protein